MPIWGLELGYFKKIISMKQRTILREVSVQGKGLHTGDDALLTLKPAPENHGIVFRRTDLYGKPEIRMSAENVTAEMIRQTSLVSGHATVHTPEHVLSAISGCGIDNVVIELDGKECPILDGSARDYVNLIQKAELVEQTVERDCFVLDVPLSVSSGSSSLIALPYDGLKITCTSADDRGIHTQHLSIELDPEIYISGIAPSRTFTIYEDIEPLIKMGKIRGGSLDCAIVIRGGTILSKEPLRFPDEFVRHKILDIIGDIVLLGKPLKAHIVAVRPGHALNNKLVRKLSERMQALSQNEKAREPIPARTASRTVSASETQLDIRRIMDILPHAYPFLLVDRVIEFVGDSEIKAIKNVTINEPFFTGHFPGNPVMPGVLQIEAMAQAAGLIMFRQVSAEGKVALFMSCDKVKFRKAVVPGDQLEITARITKVRAGKLASAEAECRVDGKVVSSAELLFTIVDASNSAN
jgi:UDP-3-O-[3-hydroxymyristoyl] N-acetylglucosamine deacetylase/3-hydroxyacyl-[acyl-carrier-protein] dehydratase